MRLVWEKFNPRNTMYISRDDGYFNPDVSRDILRLMFVLLLGVEESIIHRKNMNI